MNRTPETVITARGLTKSFRLTAEEIVAVNGVDLDIHEGEFVSLMGPSGSGKTTLLDLIGCLDSVSGGTLTVFGTDVSKAREDELVAIRRGRIGFVFQEFLLLPELTALENVQLPATFARAPISKAKAMEFLDRVGLAERAKHLPRQLSGGERQRVAIARSLTMSGKLLLADEPTGNLDSRNSALVFDTFRKLNREDGLTVVAATHDEECGAVAGRCIRLKDGRIVGR
jgi:putative ABC transport system ATP-binding protein